MTTELSISSQNLADMLVPVAVVRGQAEGPRVTVLAGVHGCEYSAMSAARRLIRELEGKPVAGQVVIIPVLNVPAFTERAPFVVPEDGKNLNRCFPGDPAGSLADRLADAVFSRFICKTDALIDMHSGDMVEDLIPFTWYDSSLAETQSRQMAEAYGLGYIVRHGTEPVHPVPGSTSTAAASLNIPAITPEAGRQGRLEAEAIETHLRGLRRVLASLGVLSDEETAPAPLPSEHLDGSSWVRCKVGGWWEPSVGVGESLARGQILGTVTNLQGDLVEEVVAPAGGVCLCVTSSPAVKDSGLVLKLGLREPVVAGTAFIGVPTG
jgi:uncharacterized protein